MSSLVFIIPQLWQVGVQDDLHHVVQFSEAPSQVRNVTIIGELLEPFRIHFESKDAEDIDALDLWGEHVGDDAIGHIGTAQLERCGLDGSGEVRQAHEGDF